MRCRLSFRWQCFVQVDSVHLPDGSRPVWFVEQNGEILGVIVLDTPDTYNYRREAMNYPDCRVWCRVMFGWAYMETNNIRSAIWKPAMPPDVVMMANLLR